MTKGFTLIEILLIIVIFSLLLGIGFSFFHSFLIKYYLTSASSELLQNLKRAQIRAQASENDSRFGIYFNPGVGGSYILYQGNDYAHRNPDYDEEYILPKSLTLIVNLSGGSLEVSFEKIKGLPSTTGTITILDTRGKSKTIHIESSGYIWSN